MAAKADKANAAAAIVGARALSAKSSGAGATGSGSALGLPSLQPGGQPYELIWSFIGFLPHNGLLHNAEHIGVYAATATTASLAFLVEVPVYSPGTCAVNVQPAGQSSFFPVGATAQGTTCFPSEPPSWTAFLVAVPLQDGVEVQLLYAATCAEVEQAVSVPATASTLTTAGMSKVAEPVYFAGVKTQPAAQVSFLLPPQVASLLAHVVAAFETSNILAVAVPVQVAAVKPAWHAVTAPVSAVHFTPVFLATAATALTAPFMNLPEITGVTSHPSGQDL